MRAMLPDTKVLAIPTCKCLPAIVAIIIPIAAMVEEFRRQLDLGMWAAVPTAEGTRHEATMVRDFSEIPREAERVVFFPPAAGG